MVLLRGIMRELEVLGNRGVILTKMYATSGTPTGIAMAMHAGMEPFGPKLGKRLAFIMDVESSKSFLVDSYKEGFSQYSKRIKNRKNRTSTSAI